MRSRLYRAFAMALLVVFVMAGMDLTAFAASGNSFNLTNMSGNAITEVYFYPSYNNSFGYSRTRQWIYNGNNATVSFTDAEMRLNISWNLRIGFNKGSYVSYALWENLTPSEFVDAGSVTITSNEYGGYTISFGSSSPTTTGSSFTLLNMTGNSITEIYFYPITNDAWGKLRNKNWLKSGEEIKIQFTPNEMALNTEWVMRLGLANGPYSFIYWEDLTLDEFVNSGYVTVMVTDSGYTIYFD